MLNKSFVGSWGIDNTENIPHEIINLFSSDNGNTYIYVPPYGGYDAENHKIECLLLTGNCHDNTTEVLFLVKGLKLMHNGGKKASKKNLEELKQRIIDDDIRYGGKLLHEIKMSNKEEPFSFYLTFEAAGVFRPIKRMYLKWGLESDYHDSEKDIFALSTGYKYQRQIGYLNGTDYLKISPITNNQAFWEKQSFAKRINETPIKKYSHSNFLTLIHKENDESSFTNLFYEFFRVYPGLFNTFAKEVLCVSEDDRYKIYTEVSTCDKRGRLDILAEGEKHIIVIENKINSGLNGIDKSNELSQLTTYIEFIEEKLLLENVKKKPLYFLFEPNYNDIEISNFDKKRGSEFKKIQYNRLYAFFKTHMSELATPPYGQYVKDFVNALQFHSLEMRAIVEQRYLSAIKRY